MENSDWSEWSDEEMSAICTSRYMLKDKEDNNELELNTSSSSERHSPSVDGKKQKSHSDIQHENFRSENSCTDTCKENENYPIRKNLLQSNINMWESTDDEIPLAQLILRKNNPDEHAQSSIMVCTQDSDLGTDMDIPLSLLKTTMRKCRERTPSPSYYSDEDNVYLPSFNDVNSSDSEDNFDVLLQQGRINNENMKQSVGVQKIGLKKKTAQDIFYKSKTSRKKIQSQKKRGHQRANETQPTTSSIPKGQKKSKFCRKSTTGYWKAVNDSRRQLHQRSIIEKYHVQKIDKLLASNGLKKLHVYPDGNCLLNSIIIQLAEENIDITVKELRQKISNHILENISHYIGFMKVNEVGNEEELQSSVKESIKSLEKDGHWESDYADFIPLCLANLYHRKIRIFSSRMFAPIFDVEPDMTTAKEKEIMLAHIAIPGAEHYESARKLIGESLTKSATLERETTPDPQIERDSSIPQIITPHKAAEYVSPVKKTHFRKRKLNIGEWKVNKRKRLRSLGLEYTSKNGKQISARKLTERNCDKCKFRCSLKISDEKRKEIFSLYWKLGNYEKQRSFICSNVKTAETKRTGSENPTRKKALSYFFTVNDQMIRVCKEFFVSTLDIGKKTVDLTMGKVQHGTFTGEDKRGKSVPPNRTPEADESFVHTHIQSFPVIESHYTRKDTRRKYLSPGLNIKKMYELYTTKCTETGKKPVKQTYYRKIFNTHYNFSFFQPKKDQCSVCVIHDQNAAEGKLTELMKEQYNDHGRRRQEARSEKMIDKSKAQNDKGVHVATFDLQAVLSVPCSLVGEIYYKRKLSCYNLSFYSLGNTNGYCFLWDETQGGRGSCEIASCLHLYLNSIAGSSSGVKEVTLFSDTCGGQNRNQFTAAALHFTAMKLPELETVNHKFFESGHSQMESDTIHSAIELTKRKTKVYVPSQWETVINLARKSNPYMVIPMKHHDFLDFKLLVKNQYKNMKVDVNGKRVLWHQIKWIKIQKSNPDRIFFNYGFNKDSFMQVNFKPGTRNKWRPGQERDQLQQRYGAKLPISEAKKNDLLSLCSNGIIPETYHTYYQNLKTDRKARDKLPMPDAEESDCDTDEN